MPLLRLLLVVSLVSPTVALASFSDVPDAHPYAEAISAMEEWGLMPGYADGQFRGANYLNRAELVKVLMRARANAQLPQGTGCKGRPPFSDVASNAWFAEDLCSAVELGIINGYPDKTFRPSRFVNLAEASKIIAKALELPLAKPSCAGLRTGTTCDQGEPWFKASVDALADHSALHTALESFDQLVRRQDIASILWRIIDGRTEQYSYTYDTIAQRAAVVRPSHNPACTVRYDVRYGLDRGLTDEAHMWDAELVRIDIEAGTQHVMLPSVKEVVPDLTNVFNYTLRFFAQPVCEGLVLQFILRETDHPGGQLYRFTPAGGIVKMQVNDVYRSTFGGEQMTADQRTLIVAAGDEPETGRENLLRIIDLQKDTSTIGVRLGIDETLNGGEGGLSSLYDLRLQNGSLQYAVFDHSDAVTGRGSRDADGRLAPKAIRTLPLP